MAEKRLLLSPTLKESTRIILSKCIVCQKNQNGVPLTEPDVEGKATLKRAAEVQEQAGEDEGR